MREERVHTIKLEDVKPTEVFAKLAGIFGNVFAKSYSLGNNFFGVVVGEKYFLRTNSDAAIIVVVSGQEDSTIIDITAAGGREGLILRYDWWTHEDFIESVKKALKGKVEHRGLVEQMQFLFSGVNVKELQTMLKEKKKNRKRNAARQ